MGLNSTILLFFTLTLAAVGCGTAPGVDGPGGAPPCAGSSTCTSDPVPESVCLEHLAAGRAMDGCGVFVINPFFGGDDANPGTKDRPVRSVRRAIELARTGRGRVFLTDDGFEEAITLPSGVDIYGGFETAIGWERLRDLENPVHMMAKVGPGDAGLIVLTVEPARAGDTGAADGVSIIDHVSLVSTTYVGMLVRSGTAVEIIGGEVRAAIASGGRHGEKWPGRAATGPDGEYGEDACSAATVPGGARAVNSCEGGIPSVGGKGGDGLADGARDGEDGEPVPQPNPNYDGDGGRGNRADGGCTNGVAGRSGMWGIAGAPGKGRGRLDETGWHADRAGDGARGMPGQGGGGGGGRRGGLAVCDVASKGGAGGGSGGAGGCGGRGGRGGENGQPSIGILALHAKVTVRDSIITARDGGQGGDGGEPERGGKGGWGMPGGAVGDGTWSCKGGSGGLGGDGGYGGPGRGGDSIGIAYLDEDQLTLEGVTFDLGVPGVGGTSWNHDGSTTMGPSGEAHETLRFVEPE
ncbi:hypothetical protein WMF27_30365 [Sorangium sp. So ce281]|uniref:hypothetical protein n=1 Tax=unclassified Sorangium TaxID=2621164 RepID=UPI003F61B0C7